MSMHNIRLKFFDFERTKRYNLKDSKRRKIIENNVFARYL